MYILRKWWIRKQIRICNGIEKTLYHELRQNQEALKSYMRQYEELQALERHRIINEVLESK